MRGATGLCNSPDFLPDFVLFQKAAELQKCCSVGDLLIKEIEVEK